MAVAVRNRRHDRRQAVHRRKERSASRKKKMFGRRIDIPEEPIRIHFQKPEEPYQDLWSPEDFYYWKKGAKHYIPSLKKYTECSPDECLTCAYQDPAHFGFDASLAKKFLEEAHAREYYAIGVWVEEWYNVVEQEGRGTDENGNARTFFGRVREKDVNRQLKADGHNPKDVELPRVFGFQGFLDLSWPAWNYEFSAVFDEIERYTKDGGYLIPMYYGCAQCGEPFFALGSECPDCGSENCTVDQDEKSGELTHKMFCLDCESYWELLESKSKDLKKSAETMMACECGNKDLPVPFYAKLDLESGELDVEEPEEGWDRYDMFDVQLTVRKQKATDKAPARIVIDKWEIKEPDPRLFDPKFQGADENEEEGKKQADYMKKAIDLDGVHAPDSPDVQAKILKLDNLYGRKATTRESRRAIRYSRNTSQTEEEHEESGEEGGEE